MFMMLWQLVPNLIFLQVTTSLSFLLPHLNFLTSTSSFLLPPQAYYSSYFHCTLSSFMLRHIMIPPFSTCHSSILYWNVNRTFVIWLCSYLLFRILFFVWFWFWDLIEVTRSLQVSRCIVRCQVSPWNSIILGDTSFLSSSFRTTSS
jgi:hypothetical protein